MRTVRLPAKHVTHWLARYRGNDARALRSGPKAVTVELGPDALDDLVRDARYYAETFHGDWVGGIDQGAAAARVLKRLRTEGLLS